MPGNLSGEAVARGEVQRALKRIQLAAIQSGGSDQSTFTQRVLVKNLSKSITVIVQAGLVLRDQNNKPPVYPATPGTLQITPITVGDGNDNFLTGAPVFQPPNFTGALKLPNGWEFASMAPIAAIDVFVDPLQYNAGTINGDFVLDILLEYTGKWWDPVTVAKLLNKVTAEPQFSNALVRNNGS